MENTHIKLDTDGLNTVIESLKERQVRVYFQVSHSNAGNLQNLTFVVTGQEGGSGPRIELIDRANGSATLFTTPVNAWANAFLDVKDGALRFEAKSDDGHDDLWAEFVPLPDAKPEPTVEELLNDVDSAVETLGARLARSRDKLIADYLELAPVGEEFATNAVNAAISASLKLEDTAATFTNSIREKLDI